ncbi:unnamed protein product [Darwinula stevensoni]|uniref:Cytochrome P450 n=1 Tax=Darwinula stevensoni TaxID=69355 RepID=A0A7R8X9Z0_9CRUS|nr:unnamed protein product [Darwinula stevensoni]CAG0891071.1 unnamed protein product [Darwinula stevensoni]
MTVDRSTEDRDQRWESPIRERDSKVWQKACKFGLFDHVVLSDAKDMKAAFQSNKFLDRPDTFPYTLLSMDHTLGISGSNAEGWKRRRRLLLQTFRDQGVGDQRVEPIVDRQIGSYLDHLEKERRRGGGLLLDVQLNKDLTSILNVLVFGVENPFSSEQEYESAIRKLEEFLNSENHNQWLVLSAIFFHLPKYLKAFVREDLQAFQSFLTRMAEVISRLRCTWASSPDDTVAAAFLEDLRHRQAMTPDQKRTELSGVLLDAFGSTVDILPGTARWIVLFLLLDPEGQDEIRREILANIGSQRRPTYSDRNKSFRSQWKDFSLDVAKASLSYFLHLVLGRLPYCQAFLEESLRRASTAPLGFDHVATEHAHIREYHIPKGTSIVSNIHAYHHDPEVWSDPERHRPERFLDESGNFKRGEFPVITFGIGRRSCPAEVISRGILFSFMTSLVQRFSIDKVDGGFYSTEPRGHALFLRYPTPFLFTLKAHP